jgi:hypothetical protein
MAGVTLGFLKYVLGLDTLNFRKGISQADADLAKLQRGFASKGRDFQKLGTSMSAFVTLPLLAIGAKSIEAAKESQQALGQVNAALASMGPVAGRSVGQLQELAKQLQHISTFDDDDILRKVTANLLTFGNVSGHVFDQAQLAIVNYASRSGKDLQAVTVAFGKALNDPIKGLTALQRVGIQFDAAQREQIKTMVEAGNIAGAQGFILDQLSSKFAGSAKALRAATPDAQLKESWRDFTETVGAFAIKVLPPITNGLAALLNAFNALPAPVQTLVVAVAAIGAGMGPVLLIIGNFMTLISKTTLLVQFAAGLTGIGVAEGVAATGATAAGIAIRGMLGPLALAAAAVTGVYLAWKNWDKIKPIIQSTVTAVADRIRGNLYPQLEDLKKRLTSVGDSFRTLYDRVVGHSYVPDMVDGIAQHFGRLEGVMIAPANKAAKAVTASFKKLKDDVSALLDQIFPEVAAAREKAEQLETLRKGIAAGTHDQGTLMAAQSRLLGADQVSVGDGQPLDRVPGGLDEGTLDRITGATTAVTEATKSWGATFAEVGRSSMSALNSLTDGLVDVLMNSGSLKDAWHNLGALVHSVAQQWLSDLLRIALKQAEMAAIKALFGAGFAQGGQVGGFATGGFVSGPGSATSDSVPALLSNGEFVINAGATKRFLPLLQQINTGSLRLAAGGIAMSGAASRIARNDNPRGIGMPNVTMHNDFRGADPSAVAAIQTHLDRLEKSLPARIVGTMSDARDRFAWKGR